MLTKISRVTQNLKSRQHPVSNNSNNMTPAIANLCLYLKKNLCKVLQIC